jgi:hypothetical protein
MYFMDFGKDLKLAEVIVGIRSATYKRELENALRGYSEKVTLIKVAASAQAFTVEPAEDELRNHDDLTYSLIRGETRHPVEFVRDSVTA